MKNHRLTDNLAGLLLAAGSFLVYLATVSNTIGTEDPGELAVVLHTLGISHPTGYPLFTLLGYVFAKLPLGDNLIWRMNLFGAVLTSLATFLFFRVFLLVFSNRVAGLFRFKPAGARDPAPAGSGATGRAAASLATLLFAFSARYWFEAVSLEVYALHLVFLALVTYLFLKACVQPEGARSWILFAYVLGLSFTHHMMTVLLAPAFLFLYFSVLGGGPRAWQGILRMVPPFLAALLLYLYLPLRAAAKPLLNWGDPSTLEGFWRHVTAAQYRQQMFTSWELAVGKFIQFWADLPQDFGYAPLAAAALGIWVLWRRSGRLLLFSFLIFATGLFYAVNYAFDDPNFYLNSHFMVALWAGFGILAVAQRAATLGPAMRFLVRGACLLVALCPLMLNYATLDKKKDSLVEDYARNVLNSMEPGAVFFSNEYERMAGPAFYLQLVEGFRSDVAVLDIVLFGNPWYYPHLEARFPWLLENSRDKVEVYRAELERFIRDPEDTVTYQAAVTAMVVDMIEKSRAMGRPVYVSERVNPEIAAGYGRLASGMVFRLAKPTDAVSIQPRRFYYRDIPTIRANPLAETIRTEYARGYANQGALRFAMGDTAGAVYLLQEALRVSPDLTAASGLLARIRHFR